MFQSTRDRRTWAASIEVRSRRHLARMRHHINRCRGWSGERFSGVSMLELLLDKTMLVSTGIVGSGTEESEVSRDSGQPSDVPSEAAVPELETGRLSRFARFSTAVLQRTVESPWKDITATTHWIIRISQTIHRSSTRLQRRST